MQPRIYRSPEIGDLGTARPESSAPGLVDLLRRPAALLSASFPLPPGAILNEANNSSEQTRSGMVSEQVGIAHIGLQHIH
jgi:hypothetical protein